jgi:hypothetical protein
MRAAALALVLLSSACATQPPQATTGDDCRQFFAALDQRIAAAHVADGGAHRVEGFPYLRADRFLASFAGEVQEPARYAAWIEALRGRDLSARAAELANLDANAAPQLLAQAQDCGRRLAVEDRDAGRKPEVAVPDDYSLAARVLGAYPLAMQFLEAGIGRYQRSVREDFSRWLDTPAALALWRPQREIVAATTSQPFAPDALGVPQIAAAQWQALLQHYAPTWWIEGDGADDVPGALAFDAQRHVTVATGDPVVYYLAGYTRLGARVLPTLSYAIWFARRPPLKAVDPYAGAIDGVIWRVVLDDHGRALAYDTIHSCGCYREHFPAQPLQVLASDAGEPPLLPQPQVADGTLALRLQSGTHFLRRVVPERSVQGREHRYRLVPYEALLSVPLPGGARASVFAEDGLLPGTSRLERWWLWVSGVRDPGAMRQFGRHATAFVGRAHFDDARFLEQVYAIPDWAR